MGECRREKTQRRWESLGPTVSKDSDERSHLRGWRDGVSGRRGKTGSQHSMRQCSHFCDLNASSAVVIAKYSLQHSLLDSQIPRVRGGCVPGAVGKGWETEG